MRTRKSLIFLSLSTHPTVPTKSYIRTLISEPFIFATTVCNAQQGRNQITTHISHFNLETNKLAFSLFLFSPFLLLLSPPFHSRFSLSFLLLLSHTVHQKYHRERSCICRVGQKVHLDFSIRCYGKT